MAEPILKWAGGKTQMLARMKPYFPDNYNTYIEPFIGGGAVFFDLNPESAILSDRNAELVNMYRTVANETTALISDLRSHENTIEYFKHIRSKQWDCLTNIQAASRMIYLNRTCFNGLYRLNKKGHFNTSFGYFKNPKILNAENLIKCAIRLSCAEIHCMDFRKSLERAQPGDLVFLDPPYMPISDTSDFNRYNPTPFTFNDQEDLANIFNELDAKGVYVYLTNSDHPSIRELYRDHEIVLMNTVRWVSCAKNRSGSDLFIIGRKTSRIKNIHSNN